MKDPALRLEVRTRKVARKRQARLEAIRKAEALKFRPIRLSLT